MCVRVHVCVHVCVLEEMLRRNSQGSHFTKFHCGVHFSNHFISAPKRILPVKFLPFFLIAYRAMDTT